ncbi:hypothetical protein OC846_000029 [Tilletia horrida]|uniref:HMG box domain-containing protein n=1 Tax=Tilletia horrida TaxID=155126 RepID=A0AAN6GWJ2_9BASI|nr:hypothetical protein OC846_000029 [Tilletia horrida]
MATGPSEWSTGLPYPGTGGIVEASLSSSSNEERPGQERIKRPHNAWIIYRTEKSREIRDAFLQGLLPAMPSSSSAHAHLLGSGTTPKREADLSKYLAAMWKAEPPNVKEHYSGRAKAEREAHLQKHPGYRFQPRKLARSRTMNSLSSLAQQQPSSDHIWPTLALHGDNSAASKLRRAPRSRTADGLGSHLHSEGSEYTSSQASASDLDSRSSSDKDARDQHAYRSQHGPSHSHTGPAFDQNAAPAGSYPAAWQDVHMSSTIPNVQLPSMGSGTASYPGRQRSSTDGQGLGMVSAHPNQHPAQLSPVYARNPMCES